MSIDRYREIFAKNLRHYMDINGKTQIDLINDLKLTRSAISTWYNGKRIPRPEQVDVLCEYFKIKRSDLMEESKEGDGRNEITIDGAKIIEAYNTKSHIKVLYDEQLNITPEAAAAILEIVRQMNKTR
jgi:transcriptional regulator with XRE-family HTH domain